MKYFSLLLLIFLRVSLGYLSGHHSADDDASVDCHAFPQAMSYHAHITYMLTNKDQIDKAAELREEALQEFADLLGEEPICQGTPNDPSGRYDNGRFCMIEDHNLTTTLGPFAVGEWSMFVPVHYYARVVPWFQQHRGDFSLLVHPNSGCEYEDHGIWAQWSGSPWNMDMSIFTQWTQTESFGQKLGTPENPACLSAKGMCADKLTVQQAQYRDEYVPQIVCCAGLACQCDSSDGHCYCR